MPEVNVAAIDVTNDTGAAYKIPYWHVRSGKSGPCLLVTAAIHGTELQGSEVIRRFFHVAARELILGECLLMPMVNRLAIRKRQPNIDFDPQRYFGSDRRNNANCVWPGRSDGNNAERLAHAIYRQIVPRATHLIDLHSYSRIWAPIAYARTGYEPSLQLVRATALRFARHSEPNPLAKSRPVYPCILSTLFNETGRAATAIEFSGQWVITEGEIRRGARAVQNCARLLGLLPGVPEGTDEPMIWLNDTREVKVLAPHSGLFMPAQAAAGDRVAAGTVLGHVLDDEDLRETPVCAPEAGWVYQFGPIRGVSKNDIARDPLTIMHPYTVEGETLATVMA